MSASAAVNKTPAKRRMLYLHGMFLNPDLYKQKLGKDFFERLGTENWECHFVQSPRAGADGSIYDAVKGLFPDEESYPEWFNSVDQDDGTKVFDGLDESLEFLQNYLKEQPKFDAVGGHSQGAMMASLLTYFVEKEPGWIPSDKKWDSVLCMNAPNSFETERSFVERIQKNGATVDTPSVHVFGGPTDETWKGQQKLQTIHYPDHFKIIQHENGHWFPSKQEDVDAIMSALNEF